MIYKVIKINLSGKTQDTLKEAFLDVIRGKKSQSEYLIKCFSRAMSFEEIDRFEETIKIDEEL